MSWFTANAKTRPVCERCKNGDGAVFIARAGDFDIYDCRRCGAVLPRQEAAPSTSRRARARSAIESSPTNQEPL